MLRANRRAAVNRRALKFEPLEDRRLLAVDISDFSTLSTGARPNSIVSGPDGNLWFTESNANAIATMKLDGTALAEYPIPTAGCFPGGIAVGFDHNLWFTEGAGKIGRFDPTAAAGSQFTEFPLSPTIPGGGTPTAMTAGPDGNLWFVDQRNNAIGKITTGGAITEYTNPTSSSTPYSIAAGPDGNLWFTELFGNNIGRITPGGAITEFDLGGFVQPEGITGGPDGAVWFVEQNANTIARITPAGAISEYPLFPGGEQPTGITLGSDGKIYFTESGVNRIGLLDPTNPATAPVEIDVPTTSSAPSAITSGSDGNIWFTEYSGSKIGRVKVPFSPNPPTNVGVDIQAAPSPVKVGNQIVYTITVKNFSGEAAQNVVLYNPIPDHANFRVDNGDSVSTSQGTMSISAGDLNSESTAAEMIAKLGTLDGGASATITLKLHVTGDGDLAENAIVVSDSPDTFLDNNSFTLHTTAQPLSASLTLGGLMVGDYTGNPMTVSGVPGKFSWQAARFGGDAATGLTANVVLSSPLTVQPFVDAGGTFEIVDSTHVTFHLPDLAPGNGSNPLQIASFGFTATANAAGTLLATATLRANEQINGKSDPLSRTITTTVDQQKASLNLEGKLAAGVNGLMRYDDTTDPPTATSGVFTWILSNTGATTATNVTATIYVPTQLTYLAGTAISGGIASYSAADRTLTFTLSDVAPGKDESFGFAVNPTSTGPVSLTANVRIDQTLIGGGSLSSTIATGVLGANAHDVSLSSDGLLPVVAKAHIVPIFYGSAWTAPDAPPGLKALPGQMHSAMESIVSGPYMDVLSQYSTSSQAIERGTIENQDIFEPDLAGTQPGQVNDQGPLVGGSLQDPTHAQVSQIITNEFGTLFGNLFGIPTGEQEQNNLYVIFTPPGTTVERAVGHTYSGTSQADFAAYHFYFDSLLGLVPTTASYIVLPYPSSPNIHPGSLTTLQTLTLEFSHELAEAVTNAPGLLEGWIDRSHGEPFPPVEIGDIEALTGSATLPNGISNYFGTLAGNLVQYIWANSYTYPLTGAAVYDQPVLPADPVEQSLYLQRFYNPLKRTSLLPLDVSGEDASYDFSGLVASFRDSSNTGAEASIYQATIDWGDNTTSAGTIAYDPNLNQFLISGGHTFAAAAGSKQAISISLLDKSNGDLASLAGEVTLDQTSADAADVQFDQAAYEAWRNGSQATITVDRAGDATLAATVDFHVSGGTAVAGTDYQSLMGTLEFPPGATTATISLPIYANPNASGDLTVNLALSTPTGNAVLGAQTTTVLTIHPSADIFAPGAPVLAPQSDSGSKVNDGITDENGSSSSPLSIRVASPSVRNGFVQLLDVTDPANPVLLGDPVQATGGTATIVLNGIRLTDGVHQLAVANSASVGARSSHVSKYLQVTIDSGGPTSQIAALPARTLVTSLPVSWAGNDNAGGTGISTYDISVSVDGGDPIPWLTNTPLTSATFPATQGHTYAFFAQGIDLAGNTEPAHAAADTGVKVTALPWQNEHHPLDVSDDGFIAPNDALEVINSINADGSRQLPDSAPAGEAYLDVTGDNFIAPGDALAVINAINARQGGPVQGEGETAVASDLPDASAAAALAAGVPDESLSALIAQLAQDSAQATENQKRAAIAAYRR